HQNTRSSRVLDIDKNLAWRGFVKARKTMKRRTVDLSDYPDLVVIYLGMRVNVFRGVMTLLGFGPKIAAVGKKKPDGPLAHYWGFDYPRVPGGIVASLCGATLRHRQPSAQRLRPGALWIV